MRPTPRALAVAFALVLIPAAVAACDHADATEPPSQCASALAAGSGLQDLLDVAGPTDSQTATDLQAIIDRAQAACAQPATTTTESSTTEPSTAPSTTEPPSTEPPTTVPATTTPPTTQPPAPGSFPTAATAGVPAGWTPTETITDQDLTITTPGAVVQDVRMVRGNIWVRAADVTIRRVEMLGGRVNNSCCIAQDPYDGDLAETIPGHGLLVEDTTFANPPGVAHTDDVYYRLGDSNYTALRVKIVDQLEGFRTGGKGQAGAGEVTIEDSYVALDTTTIVNTGCGGHPDGVQGYFGAHATIRHNTLDITGDGDCKNGAVFIADGSAGADVIGNLLLGGSFTLRANDGPFRLIDNVIADGTWQYGPLTCGGNGSVGFTVLEQHGNHTAVVSDDYEVTSVGREVRC